MLEQPTTRIVQRQHVAGAAERLTRRSACQKVWNPVLRRVLGPKVFGLDPFNRRIDHSGITQRGDAPNTQSFGFVQTKRFSAISVTINGSNRCKPSLFKADVEA